MLLKKIKNAGINTGVFCVIDRTNSNSMKQLVLLLILIGLYSCAKNENLQPQKKIQDTVIATINGKSDSYTRVASYRLVIAGDTSKTGIYIFQGSEGKIHLGLGLGMGSMKRNYIETKPYRLKYLEIEKLMKQAALDFETDSLQDVGIGFLIETGDLAIDVSRDYYKIYGNSGRITWTQIGHNKRKQIDEILLTSRAGQDVNRLLAPFGKKIDRVIRAEQLQFLPKEAINHYTTFETKPSHVPDFIMDAGIDFSVVDK